MSGRNFLYNLADNFIGYDDGVTTPGERFGAGANALAKSIYNDPIGLAFGIGNDLNQLMFQGGAMQRPEDVLGYAAAPMAPGAVNMLKRNPNVTNAITAYHGSPHDFDKFSMDKIGTGEGAQAYGHGLYFAENEAVARGYKDALKMKGYDNNPIYNEAVSNHGFGAKEFDQFESLARQTIHDPDLLARAFFDWNDEWRPLASDPAEYKNVRDFAEKYIQSAPRGSMYEVNINANPDDFLDWDAPLRDQPSVLEKLKREGSRYTEEVSRLKSQRDSIQAQAPTPPADGYSFDDLFNGDQWGGWQEIAELNEKIRVAESAAQNAAKKGALYSDSLNENYLDSSMGLGLARGRNNSTSYDLLGVTDDRKLASTLREAGIPGIKYRDAGSRGLDGETGTRNYVVFDENLINIVRKYGIAGAATALGVSASDVQAAMAQGQQQ